MLARDKRIYVDFVSNLLVNDWLDVMLANEQIIRRGRQ